MNPLLELEGVSAGYYGRLVLRDVALSVAEGTVVALIGPNGHGKTTVLRCISGLIRPQKGAIRLAGSELHIMPVEGIVEHGVVHIPQGDMLFSEMSVRDNLLMGAYLPAARRNAGQKMDEVFSLLPMLADRQRQSASTLSGGERRMLAIGRGLMSDSRVLLIDEPSLGLAPIVMDKIYELLSTLEDNGHTILLVEENVSRAMRIASRIFLLDDGRVVWNGDSQEFMERRDVIETYLGV